MEKAFQFTTPESQARRDRIVDTLSWAAFAFNFIYLAWMRAWRHALASLAALAAGVWLAVVGGSLIPIAALLIGGSWIYVGFAGKRIAWESRRWRDLDDFHSCQQRWDRWGKVVVVLLVVIGAFFGSALLNEREPRAEAGFPFVLAVLHGFVLRWIWRRLAPSAAPRSTVWRTLLIVGWVAAYLGLVIWIGVALDDVGLKQFVPPAALVLAWFAGTLTFVVRLISWSSAGKPPRDAAAGGALWSFQGFVRLAAEALTLPFRRPLTLLPFLIAVAVRYLIGLAVNPRVAIPADPSAIDLAALWGVVGLSLTLNLPIFLFAGEITSELVAQNELGKDMSLGASTLRAVWRLPASLLATLLQFLGLVGGSALLIIPGLILFVRWIFVPHAVLLARDNAVRAFRTSLQVTAGHGWQVAGLLLLIGLWGFALGRTLRMIPTVGPLLVSWLDFSWVTVATTLLYLRAGGPVFDAKAERTTILSAQSPAAFRLPQVPR